MIGEATQFLESRTGAAPRVAVVLGSGLGAFADALDDAPRSLTPIFPAGRTPRRSATRASWLSASWAHWTSP